jgi:flavin reductase (DIM6/NTAB) family NADH-FMN oxidoreductase RutF
MHGSHIAAEPAILYFGTPVVLISTVNDDGSSNLAPMSSAFWLGWRCMIGLDASSKTTENLLRSRQCVLNLSAVDNAAAVDRLARTTGTSPVPPRKLARGYSHVRDKFGVAGLTAVPSQTVAAPRVGECPVQLEAVVAGEHRLAEDDAVLRGRTITFELRIQRVHVDPRILMSGEVDRIDPDKWRPLIMSFQKFYGLAAGQIHASRLGEILEAAYRSPDVDRARAVPAPTPPEPVTAIAPSACDAK